MSSPQKTRTGRPFALTCAALLVWILSFTASAQLAPLAGAHYAEHSARASGGGAGYFGASVALDLPPVRGNLPLPLQVVYGGNRVGAAGLGWDVPLTYIIRSATIAHHRPKPRAYSPGVTPLDPPVHYYLVLNGEQIELVRNAADTAWLALHGNTRLEVRQANSETMTMFDGEGRTYSFDSRQNAAAGTHLLNGNLYLLKGLSALGNTVRLNYGISTPTLPSGGLGLEISLIEIRYNNIPGNVNCIKDRVLLGYDAPAPAAVLSTTMLEGVPLVRVHKLTSIALNGGADCTSQGVRLRTYTFNYRPDTDTQLPRLQSVTMSGRQGTPEQSVTLPVAAYTYGSIVDPATQTITYQDAGSTGAPSMINSTAYEFGISYTRVQDSSELHLPTDVLKDNITDQLFIDFNGDGRPDFMDDVGPYKNVPGPNGTTQLMDGPGIGPVPRGTLIGELMHSGALNQTNADFPVDVGVVNETLRQFIDMNGDGRIDIVETVLPDIDHWIIHLNTPDPADPTKTIWKDITVPVTRMRAALNTTGLSFGRVPLGRTSSVPEGGFFHCWRWNGVSWDHVFGGCSDYSPRTQSIVEFQLIDVNGDGYPDFVYNASYVHSRDDLATPPATPGQVFEFRSTRTPADMTGATEVRVLINTAGSHLADGVDLFSSPIVLASDGCGVARWLTDPASDTGSILNQVCGFEDVNGDGLPDRVTSQLVNGQVVAVADPGTGIPSHPFSPDAEIHLPGPLARSESDLILDPHLRLVPRVCDAGTSPTFEIRRSRALRDINGDGIPDYIVGQIPNLQTDVGTWTVALGTGTGFTQPIAVNSPLGLDLTREHRFCDDTQRFVGEVSATTTGLYDIDGDGQPEIVNLINTVAPAHWQVLQLKPPVSQMGVGSVASIPAAGRLTAIDNGYGAVTHIGYKSAKEDLRGIHNIPSPEIVVTAVGTTDTSDNAIESTIHYAQRGASLIFDPANDAFIFPGYSRTIESRATDDTTSPAGTVAITDRYPLSAFDPSMDVTARFKRYRLAGRVSDFTTLANVDVATDPWSVTLESLNSDPRRVSGMHYDWDARVLTTGATPVPASNERCIDMMYPYDFATSQANLGADWEDECTKRGFLFQKTVSTWRGTPLNTSGFTSSATVKTRTDVQSVDDFERVTAVAELKDTARSDDDSCIRTVYATPIGTNARVLTAPAARTVTADPCADATLTPRISETYEYDTSSTGTKLAAGRVAAGLLTSRVVSRRNAETGATIGDATGASDIRVFDATYDDANGVVKTFTKTRDDGATQTTSLSYDDFLLAPLSITVNATNADGTKLPSLTKILTVDPLTLDTLNETDPNGAQSGSCYDGFGRVALTTVKPAGGTEGAVSSRIYTGFQVNSTGRSIAQTVFRDAVALSAPCQLDSASKASGASRVATTRLDSLGRITRTEINLGADYGGRQLIVGDRIHDRLGRIAFEADPYPSVDSLTTAYGTTYAFNPDGTLHCLVRGNGPQVFNSTTDMTVTDEAHERLPTCFDYVFVNGTEVVNSRDAASLLTDSPQARVLYQSTYDANGRVLARDTVNSTGLLESSQLGYDALGNLNQLVRNDLQNASAAVTTRWHYDNLGQLIEVDLPGAAPQSNTYSTWGETIKLQWTDPTAVPSPVDLGVATRYDALGRLIHREEQRNNVALGESAVDYAYDQPATDVSQLKPANVLGRLAGARKGSQQIVLSYDGLGRLSARGTRDGLTAANYVEKHTYHDDGTESLLELFLPDNSFKSEQVSYTYDSAGRVRTMKYSDGTVSQDLFTATASTDLDPFGRIRHALYGSVDFAANYADTGRRLVSDITVTSPVGAQSRKIAFVAPPGFAAAFDPVGRERSRREIKNGDPNAPALSFTYDALGQLATATRTASTGSILSSVQLQYDSLGNLLQQVDSSGTNSVTLSYQTAAQNRDRVCSASYTGGTPGTSCTFRYDGLGKITHMPQRSGAQRTLSYNNLNQVTSMISAGGGTGSTADYTYNALDEANTLVVNSNTSPDTRGENYFGPLITSREEVVSGARQTVLTRNIPGPGITATRHGTTGAWTFSFREPHGTRFVTDQTGAFVQDVDYQPYGAPSSTGAQPGAPTYTSQQWNGGEWLAAIGVSRLGARVYDPAIGRFLSPDPLIIPRTSATTNPYAFAANDPVNFSDPTGLSFDDRPPRESEPLGPAGGNEGFESSEYGGGSSGSGGSGSSTGDSTGDQGFESSEYGGGNGGGGGGGCGGCGPLSTAGGLGVPGTVVGGRMPAGEGGSGATHAADRGLLGDEGPTSHANTPLDPEAIATGAGGAGMIAATVENLAHQDGLHRFAGGAKTVVRGLALLELAMDLHEFIHEPSPSTGGRLALSGVEAVAVDIGGPWGLVCAAALEGCYRLVALGLDSAEAGRQAEFEREVWEYEHPIIPGRWIYSGPYLPDPDPDKMRNDTQNWHRARGYRPYYPYIINDRWAPGGYYFSHQPTEQQATCQCSSADDRDR